MFQWNSTWRPVCVRAVVCRLEHLLGQSEELHRGRDWRERFGIPGGPDQTWGLPTYGAGGCARPDIGHHVSFPLELTQRFKVFTWVFLPPANWVITVVLRHKLNHKFSFLYQKRFTLLKVIQYLINLSNKVFVLLNHLSCFIFLYKLIIYFV